MIIEQEVSSFPGRVDNLPGNCYNKNTFARKKLNILPSVIVWQNPDKTRPTWQDMKDAQKHRKV